MSEARVLHPVPAAAPPHRIGEMIVAFAVHGETPDLSAPEDLLRQVRAEILPELEEELEGSRYVGAEAAAEVLEIDLGNWPADPDWVRLRQEFREALRRALAPYVVARRDAYEVGSAAGETAQPEALRSAEKPLDPTGTPTEPRSQPARSAMVDAVAQSTEPDAGAREITPPYSTLQSGSGMRAPLPWDTGNGSEDVHGASSETPENRSETASAPFPDAQALALPALMEAVLDSLRGSLSPQAHRDLAVALTSLAQVAEARNAGWDTSSPLAAAEVASGTSNGAALAGRIRAGMQGFSEEAKAYLLLALGPDAQGKDLPQAVVASLEQMALLGDKTAAAITPLVAADPTGQHAQTAARAAARITARAVVRGHPVPLTEEVDDAGLRASGGTETPSHSAGPSAPVMGSANVPRALSDLLRAVGHASDDIAAFLAALGFRGETLNSDGPLVPSKPPAHGSEHAVRDLSGTATKAPNLPLVEDASLPDRAGQGATGQSQGAAPFESDPGAQSIAAPSENDQPSSSGGSAACSERLPRSSRDGTSDTAPFDRAAASDRDTPEMRLNQTGTAQRTDASANGLDQATGSQGSEGPLQARDTGKSTSSTQRQDRVLPQARSDDRTHQSAAAHAAARDAAVTRQSAPETNSFTELRGSSDPGDIAIAVERLAPTLLDTVESVGDAQRAYWRLMFDLIWDALPQAKGRRVTNPTSGGTPTSERISAARAFDQAVADDAAETSSSDKQNALGRNEPFDGADNAWGSENRQRHPDSGSPDPSAQAKASSLQTDASIMPGTDEKAGVAGSAPDFQVDTGGAATAAEANNQASAVPPPDTFAQRKDGPAPAPETFAGAGGKTITSDAAHQDSIIPNSGASEISSDGPDGPPEFQEDTEGSATPPFPGSAASRADGPGSVVANGGEPGGEGTGQETIDQDRSSDVSDRQAGHATGDGFPADIARARNAGSMLAEKENDPAYLRALSEILMLPPAPDATFEALLADQIARLYPDPGKRMAALRHLSARLSYGDGQYAPALRRQARAVVEAVLEDLRTADPKTPDVEAVPRQTRITERAYLTSRAGLVIFAPYIPMLFDRLGLLDEKRRLLPAEILRARRALQLLGDLERPETDPTDPLEKLLLGQTPGWASGMEPADPPPDGDLIRSLLKSVIAQWTALGQTSPAGMQEAFVRRAGTLMHSGDAWRLTVDPGPFDMLLDRLPWSFGTVALPWMEHPLHVNWRAQDD